MKSDQSDQDPRSDLIPVRLDSPHKYYSKLD